MPFPGGGFSGAQALKSAMPSKQHRAKRRLTRRSVGAGLLRSIPSWKGPKVEIRRKVVSVPVGEASGTVIAGPEHEKPRIVVDFFVVRVISLAIRHKLVDIVAWVGRHRRTAQGS